MVTQGGNIIAGGKLLDDLDIGGETSAGEDTFEQIVAEKRRIRYPAAESGLERINVVDALADIGAFAEQVLVNVRDGTGIGVNPALAGEGSLEQGAIVTDR